jgi:hypothetical protein
MSINRKAAGLVLLGIITILICLASQQPAVTKTTNRLPEGREAIQERLSTITNRGVQR